jgi:Arc/MetJ family transcription regulator
MRASMRTDLGYGTKYGTSFLRRLSYSGSRRPLKVSMSRVEVTSCHATFPIRLSLSSFWYRSRSTGVRTFAHRNTPTLKKLVYNDFMARTNINIDESLIRKARKLTRLKTKREIVDRALELLVRSEDRKSILRYHGSGIWKGNHKLARRNRV